MRKQMKKLVIAGGIFAAVCLGCTGCGKMTPEKLMKKMSEAEAGKTAVSADVSAGVDASCTMKLMGIDMNVDIGMDIDGKMQMQVDPIGVHAEMDIHTKLMEESADTQFQLYTAMEDGTLAIYMCDTATGRWMRVDTGDALLKSIQGGKEGQVPVNVFMAGLTLEEETVDMGGRECYLAHSTVKSDPAAFQMGVKIGLSEAGIDIDSFPEMESMEIPTDIYIDKETFLTTRLDMNFEGFGDFYNEFLQLILESTMKEAGAEAEDISMEISFSEFQASFDQISYEPQEIPAVPEEAYAAVEFQEALKNMETDLGNGDYAIKAADEVVKIHTPEGYALADMSEESVSFTAPNGMDSIAYSMVAPSTEDLFVNTVESSYISILEAAGIEVETGMDTQNIETSFGTADGHWITGGGANLYYALVPVNNSHLFVFITDMAGSGELDSAAFLGRAMEYVSEITPEDILE